jgi:hypothetical protein
MNGPETLIFWGNGRQKPVKCRATRHDRNRSQVFTLHIFDDERAHDISKAATAPEGDEPGPTPAQPAADTVALQNVRSDAETLKEIARQIREGDFVVWQARAAAPDASTTASAGTPAPSPWELSGLPYEGSHAPERPCLSKALSVLDPDHLAKLAHELKTPLAAIAAAAEVMRDQRLGAMGNERYLSYAGDIHENATHALDVISSLLSESGKPGTPVSRLIALDLNALVKRTVSSVQSLAESQGLTLAFDCDKSRPHVVANPTALRQILLNLLTNAIKFTPRYGDVRVVSGYLDDGRVFLVVRDTGCGMKGKLPPAVLEPSTDGPQQRLRGTGIGLPLVQRLVREMGAEMEIDSAQQKGTVVLIAFGGFARWSAR